MTTSDTDRAVPISDETVREVTEEVLVNKMYLKALEDEVKQWVEGTDWVQQELCDGPRRPPAGTQRTRVIRDEFIRLRDAYLQDIRIGNWATNIGGVFNIEVEGSYAADHGISRVKCYVLAAGNRIDFDIEVQPYATKREKEPEDVANEIARAFVAIQKYLNVNRGRDTTDERTPPDKLGKDYVHPGEFPSLPAAVAEIGRLRGLLQARNKELEAVTAGK